MDTTSTLPRPTGPTGAGTAARALTTPSVPSRPRSSAAGTDRLGRLWRGREDDPRWARPAFLGLLVATALLYLWGLGASGWANSFYSAAVQAGSESWKAFFFGSSDAANAISVDKPPLSLWPMALSVRLFGLSGWSILVPQALMGVATVGLLHHLVRRTTGSAAAGLLAGLVMALTPVAVLMFRFNNPDALLTLLMVGSAAATLRGIEATRLPRGVGHPVRWLALGGALVGLAFLTKMLQAFLVLPALALAYLLLAQTSWGRRLGHLLVAFGSMLLAGGWWIAIVELWPASSRPYIGGSQSNSILELTLGYNGLGRLSGNETGSVGGGGTGGGGSWGTTGLLRLFNTEIGGQIAWLLPAALLLGATALWFARRRVELKAALVLWLTWLLVTGLTFSLMAGIFHAYYTVALAPAVAALVGIGAWVLWQHRSSLIATGTLSFTVALTSVLGWYLLGRSTDYLPWLKWAVVVLGLRRRVGPVRRRSPAASPGAGRGRRRRGRLPRRPRGVRREHGRHAAHRLDPDGRPDRRRRPWRTGRHARWGERQAAPAASWAPRPEAPGPAPRPAPALGQPFRHRHPGRRRRHGRPAQRQHPERGADHAAGDRRRLLHLDRRDDRGQQRLGLPARHAEAGDGDRRVQRQRPEPDAGAVRAVRRQRPDPLLHRRRRHGRPRR